MGMLINKIIKGRNNDFVGHFVFFNDFFKIHDLYLTKYQVIGKHSQTIDEFCDFLTKKCLNQIFHWEFTNREKKTKNPSYRILIKSQFCVFHHFPIIPKSTKNHVFKKVLFLIRTLHLFRLLSYQNDLISRWATQKMILVKLKMLLEFSCSIENSFLMINFLTP